MLPLIVKYHVQASFVFSEIDELIVTSLMVLFAKIIEVPRVFRRTKRNDSYGEFGFII